MFNLTVSGYANIFKEDKKYLSKKTAYITNPYDPNITRGIKEAYKCRFAYDYTLLLSKVSPFPRITHIPGFIYDLIKTGRFNNSTKTIDCIFTYFSDPIAWEQYCSALRKLPDRLKNNANYRFGPYLKRIYRDAQNELKDIKALQGKFLVDKYRFAILFYNIVTRTFYFSSLPMYIETEVYEACVQEDERFSVYYVKDEHNNQYYRVKKLKKGAKHFNETIAWWLVYNRIIHLGINR
jgi:hypothetical protein